MVKANLYQVALARRATNVDQVVLARRATNVAFTAVSTGSQRTITDNTTMAAICSVPRLPR
jgi:hypothetical protein